MHLENLLKLLWLLLLSSDRMWVPRILPRAFVGRTIDWGLWDAVLILS